MTRMALSITFPLLVGACGGAATDAAAPGSGEPVATGLTHEGDPESSRQGSDQRPSDSMSQREGESASSNDEAPGAGAQAPPTKNDSRRSMESIIKVIKDNRTVFRRCYENVQKTKTELRGDVVVNFTINAQGAVVDAQINQEGTTLKDEDVGACAANEMKKLQFPVAPHTAMDTEINYPFNFNPK